MRVVGIVQARMGSTRMPHKVMSVIDGKPLIGYLLERVKCVSGMDDIVLATSINSQNDILENYVVELGVPVFRGSEEDVLDRFYQAALYSQADVIIRLTGDCPLIDPEIIQSVIDVFLKDKYDYVSNVLPPTYPDGLDVEMFSLSVLKQAWEQAILKSEREHVTSFMHNNDFISKYTVKNDEDLSAERWVVDEPEDFEVIKNILKYVQPAHPDFSWKDVLALKRSHPDLFNINKKFQRNEGYVQSLMEDEKKGDRPLF